MQRSKVNKSWVLKQARVMFKNGFKETNVNEYLNALGVNKPKKIIEEAENNPK